MKRTLFVATILAHASLAGADDTARAKAALKAGHVHEACDAFAAAEHATPAVDTELSLADCYEQDGKPASAARMYRVAADKDVKASRRKSSLAKAEKLEARAPKLHVTVRPAQPGLSLHVDGVEVSPTEDAVVDTGPHEVVATAPGYEGRASAPVDREGVVVQVVVQLLPTGEPAPAPAPMVTPAPAPAAAPVVASEPRPVPVTVAPDHRKRNGIIIGAAGLAVLAGSVIAYEAGSSKFDDAARLCPGQLCASDADLARGHSLLSDGRTLREVSVGMGIGGVVLLAAGGYLMMTAHPEESHVAVNVDRTTASVAYTARF
jgi:hypothetical protein